MDASRINWKLVGAVLAALGYVAWRNGGLKKYGRALEKNAVVAGVLGIVAYFGMGFVLGQVKAAAGVQQQPDLPPDQAAQSLNGYYDNGRPVQPQQPQQVYQSPGPDPNSDLLGC